MNKYLALLPVLLGFLGLYVLKLNESKKFLSKDTFYLVCLISIVANLVGAFLCIAILFQ
jgi:hypothetical protein